LENKNFDNLTQTDIIKLLLHNAQHMVTREELKSEIKEAEERLNFKINTVEKKIDEVEKRLNEKIDEVEKRLNGRIDEVEKRLNEKIDGLEKKFNEKFDSLSKKVDKIETKFDRLTWLIIATIISIFAKDYILSLFH